MVSAFLSELDGKLAALVEMYEQEKAA